MAKAPEKKPTAKRAAKASKARSSGGVGRDILHVILIALISTALFTAIALAASVAIGVPGGIQLNAVAAVPTANVTAAPTATPLPTSTPIPCEAQAWWDANRDATAQVINDMSTLSINLPPGELRAKADTFAAWRTGLEGAPVPDGACNTPTYRALLDFSSSAQAVFDSFLTTSTHQQRGQVFLTAMDSLLRAADEWQMLELTPVSPQDDWVTAAVNFSRGECLAQRWYYDILVGRDFLRYYRLLDGITPQTIADTGLTQTALRDTRDLRNAFATDSAGFPECVQPASARYLASMDALMGGLNDALNGDVSGAAEKLTAASSEAQQFFQELATLTSTEFSTRQLQEVLQP
jgi:hypothetical protein